MKGTRATKRDLAEALSSITEKLTLLQSKFDKLVAEHEQVVRANEHYQKQLSYYQNPNTPPSANSLEWKRQKRRKAAQRKNDPEKKRKKPGGKKGHKGTSRRHNPEKTVHHKFERKKSGNKAIPILPTCPCGEPMTLGEPRVRDIVDIKITSEEIREHTETAKCRRGHVVEAPNDLPKQGSYGKTLVGLVVEMRAARTPLKSIATAVESLTGVKLSNATVNNILARTSDALHDEAEGIADSIGKSPVVGFDETSHRDNGSHKWANVTQSGDQVSIQIGSSRATLMLDKMDFKGIAVSDAHRVYDRFNADGRHQLCWAHDLRKADTMAEKRDQSMNDERRKRRKQYHEDLLFAFHEAQFIVDRGIHSPRHRHVMEKTLMDVLDRYRNADDEELRDHVAMMERHLPHLFTFVEYAGVDPTNNASERALRYYVVFRKIICQTKGGDIAMRRLGDFISCVLTWRNQGKSIAHEVAKFI